MDIAIACLAPKVYPVQKVCLILIAGRFISTVADWVKLDETQSAQFTLGKVKGLVTIEEKDMARIEFNGSTCQIAIRLIDPTEVKLGCYLLLANEQMAKINLPATTG